MTKKINGQNQIINTKSKDVRYIWPRINKKIEKAVVKQLYKSISIYDRSGVFEDFEDRYCQIYDRKHALLFNSGTSAIQAMYFAAGLKKGDEVICPVYTFFATVTPLLFTGATPILCDCDENGNIDPDEIIKKISKKTKAVVITHMWGIPCQMDKIIEICKKYNLLLFEDCSHAHGAIYKEKLVGSFGDISVWSLQGSKIVSGGEGGILVTDNHEYYYRSLMLGHYNKRCKQEIPKNHNLFKYATTGYGLKLRAHPLAISIATYLQDRSEIYHKNRVKYAKKYISALNNCGLIKLPPAFCDEKIIPSWYSFTFLLNSKNKKNISAEEFFRYLVSLGLSETDIPSSTCPLNLLPLFQDVSTLFPNYGKHCTKYKVGQFPRAEEFYYSAIKLPVWSEKKDEKIVDYYKNGLERAVNHFGG